MLLQERGQRFQASRQYGIRHGEAFPALCPHIDELSVLPFFPFRQAFVFQQELKAHRFIADDRTQQGTGRRIVSAIHTFQADGNHREFSHVLFAQLRILRNFQAVKQRPVASDLQKAFQHAHVQRLAKTSGSGKQIHFSPSVQKFPDQPRLVHIIKVQRPELFKAVDPDWKSFLFSAHLDENPFCFPH